MVPAEVGWWAPESERLLWSIDYVGSREAFPITSLGQSGEAESEPLIERLRRGKAFHITSLGKTALVSLVERLRRGPKGFAPLEQSHSQP